MAQKKVFVKNIPALSQALGRSHPRLYRLEQEGKFHCGAKGYDVEEIRESLATNPDPSPEKLEAQKWDDCYRKFKALRMQMEFAVAKGILINKADVIKAQVRKESDFVRALRRLRFDLPPKLHQMLYEEWPGIVDQASREILATLGKRLYQGSGEQIPKRSLSHSKSRSASRH